MRLGELGFLPLLLAVPLLLPSVGDGADAAAGPAKPAKHGVHKRGTGRRRLPKVQPQPGTEARPEQPPQPPGRGWQASASSLLLRDEQGELRTELPIGRFSEERPDGSRDRREARGGATGRGQFAWHWQKEEVVRPGMVEKVLSSKRKLSYFGTDGQVLWEDSTADAPPGLDPLLSSDDGETTLVFELSPDGWTAAGVTFASKRLAEAAAGDRIERARITANGRFAMVFWGRAEQPLTMTFLDLRSGARYDMPAADAPLARVVLGEDGTVSAPDRTLYKFPE